MAAGVSSAFGSGSAAFSQLQTLQAQRAADQAEETARVLRQRSDQAQREADAAQQNARSLKVRSDQADSNADAARRGLAGLEANGELRGRLDTIYDRVTVAKAAASGETGAAPVAVVTTVPTATTTGTVVDTTA